jgi:TPR repeat protein
MKKVFSAILFLLILPSIVCAVEKLANQVDVSEIQEICRYWNMSKKLEIPNHSCVEAAKQGDSRIQTLIGIYYLRKSDFKNAKEWFEKAAIQGDPNAQNGLGYLYQFGYAVEKDRKKANELFLKSAKQGNPDSQYWLGENLFLEGQQKEGFEWSRKAAESGSRDAQYNIAIMYKKGQGVEEDQIQSYLWFSIAARNGHSNAQKYINDFNSKLPKDVLDEMTTYVENSIKKNPNCINK